MPSRAHRVVSKVFRARWQYGQGCTRGWGWFHFFFSLSIWKSSRDKDADEFVQLNGVKIYFWWVAVGCEGVIAQDGTLGAYNTYKFYDAFKPGPFLSLDRQRFILMDNVPFDKSRDIQQAFEDVGHMYFYLSSYSPFPNVVEQVFGHIKRILRHNNVQNHRTILGHNADNHNKQSLRTRSKLG
jgi:hypothetical protein